MLERKESATQAIHETVFGCLVGEVTFDLEVVNVIRDFGDKRIHEIPDSAG